MTSCHVITGRVAPAGCSVTWFASQDRQLPFASANDGTIPCALTTSQTNVTKAVSLGNITGAERLQGRPVTLSPRLMPATSMAFTLMAGMNIQYKG